LKKLTFDEYHNITDADKFGRVHGITNFSWGQIFGMINSLITVSPPEDKNEDYEMYLKWHSIYNSPLNKALKE
jgi:hypothetical protein